MGLNIKNARVHELAREAARVTGKSQTSAIEEALERLLAVYDVDPGEVAVRAKLDVVTGLVAAYAADPGEPDPTPRRIEELYDETSGLPR